LKGFLLSILLLGLGGAAALGQAFVHPGALNTQADFDRIKARVDAQESPWYESYQTLCNDNQTSLGHGWNAVSQIVRGSGGGNFALSQRDALCIYLMALRWRLSGDARYADKAIEGMDIWSATMTQTVTGDNWGLASGLCGYLFAVAGETLRGYPGWSQTSIDNYKAFLMRFYPQVNDWLYVNHGGWDPRHGRSNWDIDNMAAMAAIGVFCDDRTIFNKAIDYFKYGPGNGQVQRWCWYLFPEGIGQQEESTRDQAHACDAVASMAMLCQIAESQGLDLYGYDNNRFLKAAEYYSRFNSWNPVSNSWNTVPWTAYYNGAPWPGGFYETNIGWAQQGAFLPVWDMLNTHFVKKGMFAPYTAALAASRRPTGNIGNWNSPDYFGYDTLTHYEEPPTTDLPPGSLWVNFDSRKVTLSWWGTPRASGYTVKRATVSGGPYTIIGTTNASTVNFVDDQVPRGQTYYYVVSATTPSGETANSAEAIGGCVTRYDFEGNASDSIGALDGTLAVAGGSGLPGFAAGRSGGQALQLNGVDQYVSLPLGVMTSHDITISTWIKWGGGNAWQRIFDTSEPDRDRNMFLTVSDGGSMRFYISDGWHDYDATLYGPVPATNTWTHVAVTIKGNTATLYENGVPVDTKWVGTQPMFGQTYTYIGKSMSNDPYFSGFIDDFRIYNCALSGAEIYALGNQGANHAPQFASDPFPEPSATEGAAYAQSIFAKAGDVDGGALTFTKISGPAWLNVAANGTLTGTPWRGDVGVNTFNVRVTDPSGAMDEATLSIAVNRVNQAPTWNSEPVTEPSITQNEPYSNAGASLAGAASDADTSYGDTLAFSKVSGPAWLSVASNGALSGTPGAGDAGVNTFTVRVTDASGLSADATLNITVIPSSLRSQYRFESNLNDGISGFTGAASGSPPYAAGRFGKAISLNGSTDFVTLPAGVANYKAITVAAWVFWNGGNIWQRVFDFGNDTSHYMFIAPSGTNGVRFAIDNGNGEQGINSGANLPTGRWTHVAVTLSGNTATLYVDGAAVGTNTGMTISPRDFSPSRNYIGDSQFAGDPCLNGMVDDFRIYNYALSASEVGALVGSVPPVTPSNFTAGGGNGASQVALSWNAAAGATSYRVERATSPGGTYTTIYSGGATSFSDTTGTPGVTYYYIVTAVDAGGESVASSPIAQFFNGTTPRAHLRLDETSGTAATDSSGNGWNGTVVGGATWVAGKINNAVQLSGTANYVAMPGGVVAGMTACTLSAWVKPGALSANSRVFDFSTSTTPGATTGAYMFLSPQDGAGKLRFAITTAGYSNEKAIAASTALTAGVWTHVAVVLTGSTGTLYVNGTIAATNNAMSLNPSSLGTTTNNYLGKSAYSGDPSFNGAIDEFQIFPRALSATEVAALSNPLAAPSVSIAAGDAQATLNWSPVANATGYNVKRGSASGGPYSIVGANVSGTTFTDTSLINSAGYFYVVTALKGVAESANSSEVSTTPVGAPPVPAGLQATGGNAAVSLSWTSSYGATSYDILRSTTSGSGYALVGTSASASYSDGGLANGTTYYYVVNAVGPNGQSANSSEASAMTTAAAPAGLTATGGNASVTLNWSASAQADSYTIKRSTTSGSGYSVVGTSSTPGFVDAGLTNGTTYYYVVSAVNAAGEGPASAEAGAAPVAPPAAPSSGYASAGSDQVNLVWGAVSGAASYSVKRSASSGGPYTVLYTGSATSFVDLTAANGSTYYYIVTASNAGGEGGASTVLTATPARVPLKAWLRFDEHSSGTAWDSTGNNWNGAMSGGATWASAGKINGSVNLNGSGNYVSLPTGVAAGLTDFTICAWVKLNSLSNWQRLFDFGTGTSVYMFLTPQNGGTGKLRFAISTSGGGGEQQINTAYAFTPGVWTHVAVTLSGSTGTLYVNGASVGTNAAMTLNPSSLGVTTQNDIGKSQYSDPYLDGQVDEFQIYGRALSGAELASLANPPAAPASLTAAAGSAQVDLSWSSVSGATTYTLKRSDANGGPYTPLASLNGTAYTDTTVVPGSPYFYVVTAGSGLVESANSTQATATVSRQSPTITSAGSASGTNGSAFSYQITADGSPTSYEATGLPAGLSVNPNTGLISGTPSVTGLFTATIGASNAGGTGVASLVITALPAPPAAPAGLTATGGNAAVSLSWTASSGAMSYNVQRSLTSGSGYTTVAGGVTATSRNDTGLADGTTYYYVVTAVNSGGESAGSAEASATTDTAIQSWRQANFGTTSNSGNAADGADPDGDGLTNASEFAAGTNPNDGSSGLRVSIATVNSSDIAVSFPSVNGKTYRLERSDTLQSGSWTTVQDHIAGTGATVQITDAGAAAQSRCFYRVILVP
jgi:fibronectin type 3 domain-containing protein